MEELIKKIENKYDSVYLMDYIMVETKKIEKMIIDNKVPENNICKILDDLTILDRKLLKNYIINKYIMEELIKKIENKYDSVYLMDFIMVETKKIEKMIIDNKVPENNVGKILDDLTILERKLKELKNFIS